MTMQSLGEVLRGLVIRMIEVEAGNPAEQHARILIARDHGHLADDEAAGWLRNIELVEA